VLIILDYQARWPLEFEQLANHLKSHLGNLALRIDHIGSTSVPGLAAKDIIDIQVTSENFNPEVIDAFIAAGYELKAHTQDHLPPGEVDVARWQKRLFKPDFSKGLITRPVNVHLRLAGSANQRYALLFRDYLHHHPQSAEAYAQVKNALAKHCPDDGMEAYYDVKDPVCDIIMAAAEAWAEQVNYKL